MAHTETLVVLDPTNTPKPVAKPNEPSPPKKEDASPPPPDDHHHPILKTQGQIGLVSGTVIHAAPIQSIDLEIDRNDPLTLHVTSHPTTWSMPMIS